MLPAGRGDARRMKTRSTAWNAPSVTMRGPHEPDNLAHAPQVQVDLQAKADSVTRQRGKLCEHGQQGAQHAAPGHSVDAQKRDQSKEAEYLTGVDQDASQRRRQKVLVGVEQAAKDS